MARSYQNITGSTAEELIGIISDYGSNIKSIILANIHASDSVNVDLYLYRSEGTGQYIDLYGESRGGVPVEEVVNTYQDTINTGPQDWNVTETTYTYYIIKGVNIPVNTTLVLEEEELVFDNIHYSMYIKLSASDSAVDIIVNGEVTKQNKNY